MPRKSKLQRSVVISIRDNPTEAQPSVFCSSFGKYTTSRTRCGNRCGKRMAKILAHRFIFSSMGPPGVLTALRKSKYFQP
jgi:hypothetical protein